MVNYFILFLKNFILFLALDYNKKIHQNNGIFSLVKKYYFIKSYFYL